MPGNLVHQTAEPTDGVHRVSRRAHLRIEVRIRAGSGYRDNTAKTLRKDLPRQIARGGAAVGRRGFQLRQQRWRKLKTKEGGEVFAGIVSFASRQENGSRVGRWSNSLRITHLAAALN